MDDKKNDAVYMQTYYDWVSSDHFDEMTKRELELIAKDTHEIEERFYKSLEFGTGGLRGIIGAGTNRMNIYTVRRATQGLANYILGQDADGNERGVAIAYDCRRYSAEFARQAALVLCGNDIKVYLFESLRPTPELSFAVRELGCIAGIVITASHNPREYNGYKAYWEDGAQIPFPRDAAVIAEVEGVKDYQMIKIADEDKARKAGLFNIIGSEIDDKFIEHVKAQCFDLDSIKKAAPDFTIVYTPLYGAGSIPVRRALDELGFGNVFIVPEQADPDPDFPTLVYPNPEDPRAFALALSLAEDKGADIILATDPDCDRVGVVTKDSNGENVFLTGNMVGSLLTEYILSQKSARGELDSESVVISTIVSTRLAKRIAESYGIQYMDTLTGFKYIGEKIKEFEQNKNAKFVFGFEESYGYLSGTYARDKDAVAACSLICEMAAHYKLIGKTLYDALIDLYNKYGYFRESVESITLPGIDGIERMAIVMSRLRDNPPKSIAGFEIATTTDYKTSTINDVLSGVSKTTLPVSDVLLFGLADDGWFCVRPSGTEPKIKIYMAVKGVSADDADEKLKRLHKGVMALIEES